MSGSLYMRLSRRFAPERFQLSRRDLMKATLAASAGLLLSDCNTSDEKFSSGSGEFLRKVIVIGGGLAGLACSYELRAAGYEVVVLEGRPRVGGRVVSFNMVPGRVVEGGGELIGSNHPTWMHYAHQLGLTFNEIPEGGPEEQLMFEGHVLSDEEALKLHAEMDGAVESLNQVARAINAEQPWNTPGAQAMDAVTMADWLASLQVSPLAKHAIRTWLEADEAVALEHQSYLGFVAMVKGGGVEKFWTDSESCRCAQGNQALATKLAERAEIRLNTEVTSIVHSRSGVMVTTREGEHIRGDDVVLAVPPTIWSKLHCTPALPKGLAAQMGTGVKYLSAVRRRYWENLRRSTDSLSDTDISMTWEATEGQEGRGPAVLTCFSGGPSADHLRSRQTFELRTYVQEHLNTLLPGYTANSTDNTRFMNWPADPWTLGAYSFPAPKQITTIGKILYEGIDRLHFAGEHTSYKFPGYMEGALDSGASLARRIAKRDGMVPLNRASGTGSRH